MRRYSSDDSRRYSAGCVNQTAPFVVAHRLYIDAGCCSQLAYGERSSGIGSLS